MERVECPPFLLCGTSHRHSDDSDDFDLCLVVVTKHRIKRKLVGDNLRHATTNKCEAEYACHFA